MIPARIDPSVAIRIHLNSGRSPLASFTSNPWVTSDLAVDQYHFHRRRNQKRLPVHFSFLSRCVSSQTMRENFDATPSYALRTGSSEGGKATIPRCGPSSLQSRLQFDKAETVLRRVSKCMITRRDPIFESHEYASSPHGSAHRSRDTAQRFRDEPS